MRLDREPEQRWDYEPPPPITLCAWLVFALILAAGVAAPALWIATLPAPLDAGPED